jgi:beta-ureidopropionase / N-carbamoyl-L-amino-acid hydrolase
MNETNRAGTVQKTKAIEAAVDAVLYQEPMAISLFDELREKTTKGKGVFRDAYGEGENFAHRLVSAKAAGLDLLIEHDAAANTYMTMPGRDRRAPRVIIGSHLDSVPDGGNFDGAAGVVAGMIAIAALKAREFRPVRDITVMAIRAEESVWFNTTYFGSRAALGRFPLESLDKVRRFDTGYSLSKHLKQAGGDPDALRTGHAYLSASEILAYLEVHIEQGPVLEAENLPVGIVTGIRGNYRCPAIKIYGEYNHCGGMPRAYRRDSVVAACEFVHALDRLWAEWEREGKDMAFTVGKLYTNSARHALTKIAGEVTFSLDVRSLDPDLLNELERRVKTIAAEIMEHRDVTIDLSSFTRAEVGRVDPSILRALCKGAEMLNIPIRLIASGASHDAAAFAQAGIPMGMLFIRNANGSHNRDEKMEIRDLLEAARLLTWWLVEKGSA